MHCTFVAFYVHAAQRYRRTYRHIRHCESGITNLTTNAMHSCVQELLTIYDFLDSLFENYYINNNCIDVYWAVWSLGTCRMATMPWTALQQVSIYIEVLKVPVSIAIICFSQVSYIIYFEYIYIKYLPVRSSTTYDITCCYISGGVIPHCVQWMALRTERIFPCSSLPCFCKSSCLAWLPSPHFQCSYYTVSFNGSVPYNRDSCIVPFCNQQNFNVSSTIV